MTTENEGFHTQSSYTRREAGELSPNLEDFAEMIYRMGDVPVRVRDLSEKLGVSPSVASRSASSLRDLGYCSFEKYGFITLTERGTALGEYLIRRHRAVEGLLSLICGRADLCEVEQIEHFLSEGTVASIEDYLQNKKAFP